MDIEDKIKQDMRELGCKSDYKISLAYYLYLYLVDEKLMYDVEYCYNRDIDVVYIVARPSKNEQPNIYVPITKADSLGVLDVHRMQENLCTVETGPIINIAFVDGDLTMCMYTFTKGLDQPVPDANKSVRRKQERRDFINIQLHRQSRQIFDAAINGGSVDDDDCQVQSC